MAKQKAKNKKIKIFEHCCHKHFLKNSGLKTFPLLPDYVPGLALAVKGGYWAAIARATSP
ncbi:MAG: hypothetical protein LBJ14_05390 [Desulfarculales bacterium]|jgi:hypothetical protein|nr:hypothetical protein [Desulfarculales bacterium]